MFLRGLQGLYACSNLNALTQNTQRMRPPLGKVISVLGLIVNVVGESMSCESY